jgi:hypothetical protein
LTLPGVGEEPPGVICGQRQDERRCREAEQQLVVLPLLKSADEAAQS